MAKKMGTLRALLITARPHHIIKNGFLLVPILFAHRLADTALWIQLIPAVLLYSLAAGSVYMFNDLLDREQDRNHPRKKKRPLAAGAIGTLPVIISMLLLAGAALAGGYLLAPVLTGIIAIYLFLNLLYSVWLKHVPYLDMVIVSTGFVLRVLAGGLPFGIFISPWLITVTYLLTLLIVITKREMELRLVDENESRSRQILELYSVDYLHDLRLIITPALLVVYVLYTHLSIQSDWMVLTIPVVVYSLFRYHHLTTLEREVDSPVDLFYRDRALQLAVLIWLVMSGLILHYTP